MISGAAARAIGHASSELGAIAWLAAIACAGCSGIDDATTVNLCDPRVLEPHWISEGETLEIDLACHTRLEIGRSPVSVQGLPPGAHYDAIRGIFSWTPALDQAAIYAISIALPEKDQLFELMVGVADAHDHPDNENVADPSRYTREYGLPVVFLDPAPVEAMYAVARFTFDGHRYAVEAKLRGETSRAYPKKNYTIEFDNDDLLNAPGLGMGFESRKKIVLTSTFDDNAFIRQRLAFELWDAMDPEHIQINSASVVLYIDGRYHGLYSITDHVDRHLMRKNGFLDTGNLYKAESYAADYRLADPIHAGMVKKSGLPEDDFSDLWELISFVDTASDAEFRARADQLMDLRDYRDWWVFATLISADDSVSKNSYHYFEYPGAVARYVPWDFNGSFGQSWKTDRMGTRRTPSYFEWNRIFERLFSSSEQTTLIRARFEEMLGGVFSAANVDSLIDGYLEDIGPSARRDWAKWEASYRDFPRWHERGDFTSFEEEVAFVRAWCRERWAFLHEWYPGLRPSLSDEVAADDLASSSGSGSGSGSP